MSEKGIPYKLTRLHNRGLQRQVQSSAVVSVAEE